MIHPPIGGPGFRVAPSGLHSLGPAHKAANLAAARAALGAPAPDPAVVESVEAFMRRVASIEWLCCPHCREGRFGVVEVIPPAERGPPLRGPP